MEKNESYHTIKNLTLGQTEIEICIESIPTIEKSFNKDIWRRKWYS